MSKGGVLEIKVVFKGMQSSPAIKEYAEKRSEKISKHLHKIVNCNYVFQTEKGFGITHLHVAASPFEASAEARAENNNIYAAIDEVTDKLEQQARKHNEKVHSHT